MDDVSLDDSYDGYPRIEEAFQQRLDESLGPRGPESLFEIVGSLGLSAGASAVDVGCGEGEAAAELVARFGLRVHGVDPVGRHGELSRAASAGNDRFRFSLGTAEALPVDDASVDLVWCKEVLMYADLDAAFGEFRRVLRPGGVGLAYQVCTGPLMADAEADEFWSTSILPPARSVRPSDLGAAIERAGLVVRARHDFGSEWGEVAQERAGAGGRRLVHAARLLRRPERYVEEFGEAYYRVMLGDCLWHVYRMIGKLHGAAFVFERPQ